MKYLRAKYLLECTAIKINDVQFEQALNFAKEKELEFDLYSNMIIFEYTKQLSMVINYLLIEL